GAMVAIGAFSSGFQLLNNVNLMERCHPDYYGRVMSVTMMSFGLQSVFAYPFGIVADALGERTTLMAMACGALFVVSLGLLATRGRAPSPEGIVGAPTPRPRLRRELR